MKEIFLKAEKLQKRAENCDKYTFFLSVKKIKKDSLLLYFLFGIIIIRENLIK